MRKILLTTILLAGITTSAYASDCNDGLAAFTANNFQKAVSILQPLAEAGDACSQYQLGVMNLQGYGVKKDHAKALEYFQAAADQGDGKAKYQAELLKQQLKR